MWPQGGLRLVSTPIASCRLTPSNNVPLRNSANSSGNHFCSLHMPELRLGLNSKQLQGVMLHEGLFCVLVLGETLSMDCLFLVLGVLSK
jgi:hypothetical protein